MTSSENNDLKEVQREANTYEDEINLMDYLRVLWKWKYLIFLLTVLPALIVGITFFLSPRDYKATYVYDVRSGASLPSDITIGMDGWNLDGKNYELLLNRFYSEENLDNLIDKLRKNGLEKYARQLNDASSQSMRFVVFEVLPPFLDISKLNITSPDHLKQIRDTGALLLKVTIIGKPREDMHKISSVIRNNIENVVPLYTIQEQLSTCIIKYNNSLADIEKNRFSLELSLKKIDEVLTGLKKVSVGILSDIRDNIVLQFNVGEQSQYLPLNYQIQAAESKRIELEESIKANEEEYKYYKDLLDLNNRIIAELSSNLSSDYSAEQFKSFLAGLVAGYEKPQLKDYLSSYIKKIENRMSASKPITERPKIYPLAKGTVKKSGIVFVVSFMISVFAAFLLEGLKKDRTQAL